MSATVPLVADSASTSRSRSDSGLAPSLSAASARAGSTTRWPRATRRIASASSVAGASLSRNPVAPASIARRR